jgi:hypothetical protein
LDHEVAVTRQLLFELLDFRSLGLECLPFGGRAWVFCL